MSKATKADPFLPKHLWNRTALPWRCVDERNVGGRLSLRGDFEGKEIVIATFENALDAEYVLRAVNTHEQILKVLNLLQHKSYDLAEEEASIVTGSIVARANGGGATENIIARILFGP